MLIRIATSILILSASAYVLVGTYVLYKLPDFTTIKVTYTHGINIA